jgi:23S rRNA (pseudouridine1915-N3)-methyltransferase
MSMPISLRFLWVGRTERGHVSEGVAHYLERVRRLARVEETVIPEAGRGGADWQQATESARILAALRPGERVVVLDERGRQLASPAFAARLGSWADQGVRQLVFVTGGAYGLNEAVRQRADLVLALSPMVFPHQLVRLILAEQVYRALSILKGTGYHHG